MKKILETKRLILCEFTMQDAPDLFHIQADGGFPPDPRFLPLDIEYSKGFLKKIIESYKQNGFGLWAIINKTNNTLIGYCGIHKITINENEPINELAYRIYKPLWGNGFATEAAKAVKEYAFNVLKLPQIVSCIAPNNERSIRVAEKNGLKFWKNGIWQEKEHKIYRIIKPF
jgi:RimJ/RimL family protein N-acetyltransferase